MELGLFGGGAYGLVPSGRRCELLGGVVTGVPVAGVFGGGMVLDLIL